MKNLPNTPNTELVHINMSYGEAIDLVIETLQYIVDNDIDLSRYILTNYEAGEKAYIILKAFVEDEDFLKFSSDIGDLPKEAIAEIITETEMKIRKLFHIVSLLVTITGDEEIVQRDLCEETGEDINLKNLKKAKGLIEGTTFNINPN